MKNLILLCSAIILFSSCKDKIVSEHFVNVPIYEDFETFRNAISLESPRAIEKQIGIYKWNQYLFVVEENEGVHFIDNSDPSNPNKIGFLEVQGCSGLAIKDNNLYVDNLIDVAVIDISSIEQPEQISRLENIFSDKFPVGDNTLPYQKVDPSKGVVVAWETQMVKEEVENSQNYYPPNSLGELSLESSIAYVGTSASIAGSITKFALVNDYLYIMDRQNLHPINIANPQSLVKNSPVQIWRNVETLFPHDDKIFMGTTTGMMIYSTSKPSAPNHLGTITHTTAWEPVVVKGDYAYVTVRSGTTCFGNINELEVVNISNPTNPFMESTFEMTNPHGLGVDGNSLYLCDGESGLKVFDCTNPTTVGNHLTQTFSDIHAIDVIPHAGVAIVLTSDGIYQYDISDPQSIQYLSQIK